MGEDPWGIDEPEQQPEQLAAPADPEECPTCHRLPLHRDQRASEQLLARIRADARDRLSRTESALASMHEADRIAVARWLTAALERPPLSNRQLRSFAPIRDVLDALWRDIYWTTPDPLSPIAGKGPDAVLVPVPHHELVEMREEELVEP